MDHSLFPVPPCSQEFKLIGWGAGWDFDAHYPAHGIELAYTIDIYPQNVGKHIHGVEVRGPDALRHENPAHCLILIYSGAWFEVFRQIRACGPFRAIRAHGDGRVADSARRAVHRAESNGIPRRTGTSRRGIIIQGPLNAEITSTVVRHYAFQHPDAAVILSTWKGEDVDELERLRPFVDSIVLSEPPAVAGDHNRNFQIRSTLAGLEEAERLGVRRVAKTRTDVLLDAPSVLETLDDAVDSWPVNGELRSSMRSRIVLLSNASWRYLPYHYTDQVMYGDVDDLLRYWAVPFQESSFPALRSSDPFVELSRSGAVPECYFAIDFLKRSGSTAPATVEHSWEVLRDAFVMIDGDALGWLWWKVLAMFEDPPSDAQPDPYILLSTHTHATWRALIEDESWRDLARAVDRAPPPLSDYYRSGVKVASA